MINGYVSFQIESAAIFQDVAHRCGEFADQPVIGEVLRGHGYESV